MPYRLKMMHISLPASLQPFNNGSAVLTLKIHLLNELPLALKRAYPQLAEVIFTPELTIKGYVHLYDGETCLTDKLGEPISLKENTMLNMVTSVAGG